MLPKANAAARQRYPDFEARRSAADIAQVGLSSAVRGSDWGDVDENPTPLTLDEVNEMAHQFRLASAACADDAERFSGRKGKANMIEYGPISSVGSTAGS